ncbi:MAG TPA: DUF6335 family protein [Gemmatimonadales bacterium]|nr:DUF6335 family protein [Gemmatimonadales bacterium]
MTPQAFYRAVMEAAGESRREAAERGTAAVFHAADRQDPGVVIMGKKKTGKASRSPRRPRPGGRSRRAAGGFEERAEPRGLLGVVESHPEAGPRLSGGDLDADWPRAESSGEEAVGGSVATPDQDVVDEIGRALGVEQPADAEFVPSEEILRRRDRLRWHLERDAAEIEAAREEEERW